MCIIPNECFAKEQIYVVIDSGIVKLKQRLISEAVMRALHSLRPILHEP
jgi:hypothetical protein